MATQEKMTEPETREKLRLARHSLQVQLSGMATKMAELSIRIVGLASKNDFRVAGKPSALTAFYQETAYLMALIEFIDQLDIDGANSNVNIRDELERRHAGIVKSLERSAAEASTRTSRFISTCLESRDKGKLVPLGDKARKGVAGDNARVMKDLAILGFIQQLGIISRSAKKSDL